jgi:hypothetical protein
MMSTEQILLTIQENQAELRRKGLKTLVLIGAGASSTSHLTAIEFLAELDPPFSYEHLQEIRRILAGLLERPVDVTLANPNDQAVRPFLDPGAIFIL